MDYLPLWKREDKDQLGLGLGTAQRTLRDLCASGDVRSVRWDAGDEEPQLIKPSEWLKDQVDFEASETLDIRISDDDLRHWQGPTEPAERTASKRNWAKQAIKALWPDGIPKPLGNPQIEKQVGDWLTEYCKKNGLAKPEISRDTILRAANRKASRALP
jgi:hypothetical protein